MKMEYVKVREADGLTILSDGAGHTAAFEFVELYVLDGAEYAVLLQEGDDMVTILCFEEAAADGRERYYPVEDDGVFEELCRRFAADHGDEFDFESY